MNVTGIWQTALAMENAIKDKKHNMERAFTFKFALENRLEEIDKKLVLKR
jgi:hypothetical protein